jgi:ATP-dependent protease ClpP protease subunit
MKSEINIRNTAEVCYIDIDGTIGVPEEWQFDDPSSRVTTYEKFKDMVAKIADIDNRKVVVNIRSTGGDVNDALLIYEALCALDAQITTRCYGYTASAATIIAQAASEGCRQISANALYLIHNSICATEGNAAEMEAKADLLHKTDRRLAEVYAMRSGRKVEEFVALMNENGGDGRWLSPEEVIEAALADEIINDHSSKSADKASVVASVTDKLTALLAKLGLAKEEKAPLPEDRNILHFEMPTAAQPKVPTPSAILFQEGQRSAAPTQIKSKEDPSINGETYRSANDCAYAADVRSLSRF